jgi:N4-gp56 family major capsid protein
MATTSYGRNDALTAERWAKRLAYEAAKSTTIAPLIGTDSKAIIHKKTELKSGGDKITFGLRVRPTGDGVGSTETLEGNEEALTTYSDAILIDELNHAMRVDGADSISQQRVLFNMRDECRMGLGEWFADRTSIAFFNQICGYTPQTNLLYTGLNAVIAPSSDRQVWADADVPSANTADEDIVAADTLKLEDLTFAKERAMTVDVPIRPIMVNGAKKFCVYLHPYQVVDLKIAAQASGSISWADIQLAALAAKADSNNPIYTGALGEYDGMVLKEAFDVRPGVNSADGLSIPTVRRAVLLGAQAAAIGYGKKRSQSSPFKWVEDTFDYERQLGVAAKSLYGLKKCQFNGQDFGSIVISSYAVAHG